MADLEFDLVVVKMALDEDCFVVYEAFDEVETVVD